MSFDEPGTLIDVIRAADEELLVVVEDAPSGDASAIFEVLMEFEQTGDVAFLLGWCREGSSIGSQLDQLPSAITMCGVTPTSTASNWLNSTGDRER